MCPPTTDPPPSIVTTWRLPLAVCYEPTFNRLGAKITPQTVYKVSQSCMPQAPGSDYDLYELGEVVDSATFVMLQPTHD